jgi:glycine/D-amino acid oxidase-like deaminating enzyme
MSVDALRVDVAIVGGGLVGASLALALEPTGLRVALIEGVAPEAAVQPSFDDRTTALGNGTRRFFEGPKGQTSSYTVSREGKFSVAPILEPSPAPSGQG